MRPYPKLLSVLAATLFAAAFSFAQNSTSNTPSSATVVQSDSQDAPAPPDSSGPQRLEDWNRFGPRRFHREMGRGMAFGEGMRGHRHPGFLLARLVSNPDLREKIGITDEQAAKISQQFTEFRKARIRTGADLRIKRLELENLLSAEKPDRAAIDRKLQEVGAAQLAREKSSIDFHLNMKDALTPEQRQKLRQLAEESHRGAFGRGHEGRRGPGGVGPRTAPAPNLPNQE